MFRKLAGIGLLILSIVIWVVCFLINFPNTISTKVPIEIKSSAQIVLSIVSVGSLIGCISGVFLFKKEKNLEKINE